MPQEKDCSKCKNLDRSIHNCKECNGIGKVEFKNGMYGEMPKLQIGEFTIALMSDLPECDSIWIQDERKEGGEGGEFPIKLFEQSVSNFFNNNF